MTDTVVLAGVSVGSPNGGPIHTRGDDDVAAPGSLVVTDRGAAFGPLGMSVPASGQITLGHLAALDEESPFSWVPSWLPGVSMVAAAVAGGDDATCSRRAFVGVAGGVALGGASASPARASGGLGMAFRLDDNTEGVRLRVRGDGPVLPPDQQYEVVLEGRVVSEFDGATGRGYVPPDGTGVVRVVPEASGSLLAGLRGFLENEVYDFEFELSAPANRLPEDRRVDLSTAPMAVETIHRAGPDGTIVTLDGRSVPHADERGGHDVGEWSVDVREGADALVYEVGPDPPAETTVSVRTSVGPLAEARDDAGRVVG